MGWHELVNIQAPKDRAWARDERALDLLAKCLEVRCAQYVAGPSQSSPTGMIRCCARKVRKCDVCLQVDPSKRISAETALAHEYFTSYACLFSPSFSTYYTSIASYSHPPLSLPLQPFLQPPLSLPWLLSFSPQCVCVKNAPKHGELWCLFTVKCHQ